MCVTTWGGSQLLEEGAVRVEWCPSQPVFKLINRLSTHRPWHRTFVWTVELLCLRLSLCLTAAGPVCDEAGRQTARDLPTWLTRLSPIPLSTPVNFLVCCGKVDQWVYQCACLGGSQAGSLCVWFSSCLASFLLSRWSTWLLWPSSTVASSPILDLNNNL